MTQTADILRKGHTPGPWSIERKGLIIKGIGPCVPDEYAGSAWLEVSEKDARLIAAAPDLLEALKAISRHIDSPENFNSHINKLCDEAIAKAEDRDP